MFHMLHVYCEMQYMKHFRNSGTIDTAQAEGYGDHPPGGDYGVQSEVTYSSCG